MWLKIESKYDGPLSWTEYTDLDGKVYIISPPAFSRYTPARVVNMLSNLQPLWKKDNLEKKDKWHKKQ